MLVLSRKTGEDILIPELDIRLTVVSLSHGRVRIGISAPRHIDVTRPEATQTTKRSVTTVMDQVAGI